VHNIFSHAYDEAWRLPPHNLEAEKGLLGSMIVDNSVIDDIIPIVKPGDMYRDVYENLLRAILDIHKDRRPVNIVSLEEYFQARGGWDKVGGMDTVFAVVESIPHAGNAVYYAGIVQAHAVARAIGLAAQDILKRVYSRQDTAEEIAAYAEATILEVCDLRSPANMVKAGDLAPEVMEAIVRRRQGEVAGIETGWKRLDLITGGFTGGDLIILAGRPSMGKTAAAINMADYISGPSYSFPPIFFSLEMSAFSLAQRLIVTGSQVPGHKVNLGNITDEDLDALDKSAGRLRRKTPIYIDDTPGLTLPQIASACRRAKARLGIGIVFIDYLQLIESDERGSRNDIVAKMSKQSKRLARELDVPVVLLSQLNREAEKRDDHRPRMADLRESGAIEQDADHVILVHRPEYYDPNDNPGGAEFIVAKNRNGRTGTAKVGFVKDQMRFINWDRQDNYIEAAGDSDSDNPFLDGKGV
jgi:replicative DNA helicase